MIPNSNALSHIAPSGQFCRAPVTVVRVGVSMTAFASGSSLGMNTKLNLRNHLLLLKYDRSGRSSGVAIIMYEKPAEASRAKKEFEGKLAKGWCSSLSGDLGLAVALAEVLSMRFRSTNGNRLRHRTTSTCAVCKYARHFDWLVVEQDRATFPC